MRSKPTVLTPRLQYWAEQLRACSESGLSLSAYAAREGLKLDTLYVAKSRLKALGAWPLPGLQFVRVTATSSVPAEPGRPMVYRISLPNGVVVETAGGELSSVLAVAGQLR
jgi:hypothetical protein